MTCHFCSASSKKFGKYGPKKIQRYRCLHCGKTFTAEEKLDDMYTSVEEATRVINLLVEGVGINAASRLSGFNKVRWTPSFGQKNRSAKVEPLPMFLINGISVQNAGTKEIFLVKLTVNENGECVCRVDGVEMPRWRVLQKALEPLFFV